MTISEYYQNGSNDDVFLLDEFDQIIYQNFYGIFNDSINGIWSFKDKNVYAFSATSSMSIERLVFKTISNHQKLTFNIEYEFINAVERLHRG